MFNPDINKILELLLPVALRQPRMKAWLKAIAKPLKELLNVFQNYRLIAWEALTHTGQVMYLEHLLNNRFIGPDATHIHITDSDDPRQDDYLYNLNEGQQPIYLYNKLEDDTLTYLNNKIEFVLFTDFVVNIPDSHVVSEPQIRQTVDRYRPAGKRFSIEYYQVNP